MLLLRSIVALMFLAAGARLGAQATVLITTVVPAPRAPLSTARDIVIDLGSATVRAQWPSGIAGNYPNGIDRPVVTSDSRFIVTASMVMPVRIPATYQVTYRDLVTGTTGALGDDIKIVVAHPTRSAVYVGFWNGDIGLLEATGLRRLPVCTPDVVQALAASRDGHEVYAACSNTLRVLDSTTGMEIRRFTLGATPRHMVVVGGNRLFTLDTAGPFPLAVMEMSVYDVSSGTRLANAPTPIPNQELAWAVPSPDGTRVIVGVDSPATIHGAIPHVIDSRTAATLDVWPFDGITHVAFTSTGDRAVLLNEQVSGFDHYLSGVLLDVPSVTVLAEGPLGVAPYGGSSHAVILEPPLAPDTLSAAVSGSHVSLRWTMPALSRPATDYLVEAGTTPTSFELLAQRTGSEQPVFVAATVPSGVFYVRVRGLNATGTGAPSPPIEVRVP